MQMVKSADQMFYDADIPEVKLLNCNATSMVGMFLGAKVNKVEGLDTSKAVDITDLFRN